MKIKDLLKSRKFFIGLIIFIGLCILGFIFLMVYVVKLNSECMANPFVFAADRIIVSTNQLGLSGKVPDPMCSCSVGASAFYFDHEGVYKNDPRFPEIFNKG